MSHDCNIEALSERTVIRGLEIIIMGLLLKSPAGKFRTVNRKDVSMSVFNGQEADVI